jgi:hypothetical protein
MRLSGGTLLLASVTRFAVAYDPVVGLQLAYLEKAVYCGEDSFNKWDVGDSVNKSFKVNTSQVRFVHNATTNGAAGVGKMLEPAGCFVAMRGTVGDISSLLDAKFWLTDFGRASCVHCTVEFGFKENYESIKGGIFGALTEFGCKDKPLFLTGHSLGAAGIQMLLFDVLDSGYTVSHMYALEAPRPGCPKFANSLRKMTQGLDTWRVSHYKDIVPHIPPSQLYYEHPLREIYYNHESGTHYSECGNEDASCSLQWWLWQTTPKDHTWYADINPCHCSRTTVFEI